MEQLSRREIGDIDIEFLQRQWELQNSIVSNFTNLELQSIYDLTSQEKTSYNIPEEKDSLVPHVLSGNPVALHELAQRDGGLARITHIEMQQKLLLERGILLLIAAVKGNLEASKNSLYYADDEDIEYNKLSSLNDIIALAQKLAPYI